MSEAWKQWERDIAAEGREYGLPWERRLRVGDNHDLLDIDGCLPDGFLFGGKAIGRRVSLGDRMSDAMLQNDRAVINAAVVVPLMYPNLDPADVVPVQVIKRMGYPTGRAYAVTEFRYMLRLVAERRKWRTNQ